jgi:hypothetical protein
MLLKVFILFIINVHIYYNNEIEERYFFIEINVFSLFFLSNTDLISRWKKSGIDILLAEHDKNKVKGI